MTKQLQLVNSVPAREVRDLAVMPMQYREVFLPRGHFAQPSPLDQPREQTGMNLEYEDDRKAVSVLRGFCIGFAVEVVALVCIIAFVFLTGRY